MDLNYFRQNMPQLKGLSDEAAIGIIQRNFYPEASPEELGGLLGYKPEPVQEPKKSATIGDYLKATNSGLGQGIAGIGAAAGTFLQAPAANTLAGVLGATAAADRGLTWAMNKVSPGSAKLNDGIQEHARLSSRFAADTRDENANSAYNLPAQLGRAMEEDSRRVASEIQANDEKNNPELIRQQREQEKAKGFTENVAAAFQNPLSTYHSLARSAPDMALGMGAGATAARMGSARAIAAAESAAEGAAAEGASAAAQKAAGKAAFDAVEKSVEGRVSTTGMLSEAGSSAMQAREGTYQQVMSMPVDALHENSERYRQIVDEVGGDKEAARKVFANELADQAPILSGLATGSGTLVTNKMFGGDATAKTINQLAGSGNRMSAKEFGRRVAQDTLEEGIQGVPEDAVQYGAMVQADPSKEFDPGGSFGQNAVAGLLMGSPSHGVGYVAGKFGQAVQANAKKSGGIVSRAGLAATPGAQQPNPAAPNRPAASPAATAAPGTAGNTVAAPSGASAAAGAPSPYFDGVTDEALESMGSYLATRQTMTDGTPITEADRQLGRDALAELQRRRLAAKAGPQPVAGQTQIQASALSAIEQAIEVDKQRRRAAGEVVEDEVEEVDVVAAQPAATMAGQVKPAVPQVAPTQPAAKPPLSNERDSMLPQAIDVLRQGGRPSISSIQRGLKIGYNRAARILEEMERDGVVGPMDATGMRQVLSMPAPPGARPTQPTQPASAGFSSPKFDNSPIPKMDPAAADEQRRQFAEFEQKRKNRRAGTRASAWERNPFMAFLGANGINRDVATEFAPGLIEKRKAFVPGYGPVFRPNAKSLDELVQNAKEDGFLQTDDDVPELYDLVDRALRGERIAPLYADGAAEAEGQRRQQAMQEREGATYEDYLVQQADPESEDFDPLDSIGAAGYDFGDDDMTDYAAAQPALQAEVAALAQHYYDLGFDPDDVLERLSIEAENQPEQTYYDLAKSRFTQLLEQALAGGQGAAQQGSGGDVRRDAGQASDAQADGVAAGGQGQAAAVAPQAAPAAAQPKRADAIRAKLDSLKVQGFSRFTQSGGRTLALNPDTYETIELSPAEVAVGKAMARQTRAGLQSLQGRREPARPQDAVLQSYTPADVLAQDERAGQQQANEQAARTRSEAEAQASDERRRIQQASFAAADSFELGQNPLDSLTGQQDILSAPADEPRPAAGSLAGDPINDEWTAFNDQSGTLGIPRTEMPQIKAEHRGAMIGFLKARGIDGQQETIPSAAIKPTQAEFSPAKVKKAMDREGGNRSIIVSADGHVVDGHHQWLAAREKGEPIQAIRLDQNIREVLDALKEMPSAQPEVPAIDASPTAKWRKSYGAAKEVAESLGLPTKDGKRNLKLTELVPAIEAELAKREKPQQQGQQNEGQDKRPAVNLDTLIGVAADSINKLRAADVDRVISEAPAQSREALAQHIRTKRPDLAGEVDSALEDTQPAVKPGADEVGSAWSRMTSIDREAAGLRAKLPKAAAAMWAKRGWDAIDSVIKEKLAKAMETPAALAMARPPEVGPFGPILTQYRGDAQGAIKALTDLQDGEAVAALHHPDVGDIDLVWGSAPEGKGEGLGLAKLLVKHPEVLGDLQGFISRLKKDEKRSGKNRIRLTDERGEAVVSLDWKGDRKVWLLTAYEKETGVGTTMDTAGNEIKGDTARLEPSSGISVSESTVAPQPDPELITIFDQLNGRTERTREQGAKAAAASPQADRIQLVQDNFHNILLGLMDAGQLEVNGSKTVNEDNQKCL